MALRGSAFLAIWNEFDPARDAEYNCWHTFEHVSERVGIPGILCGRRYLARERADERYFTLYELDTLAVLDGADYLEVVERPTEWSSSMRPSFKNFLRQPCTTLFTSGRGIAGSIATFRINARSPLGDPPTQFVRSALLPFIEANGITSMHLGAVDSNARFPIDNAMVAEPGANAQYVLLVEGIDRRELDDAAPRIAAAVGRSFPAIQSTGWKSFDLALVIERSDLQNHAARQPARADLKARW